MIYIVDVDCITKEYLTVEVEADSFDDAYNKVEESNVPDSEDRRVLQCCDEVSIHSITNKENGVRREYV